MFSSTIDELASVRDEAALLIDNVGIAQSWRYEVHAVASGARASEQYLGIAATCDLFVLIVASEASQATEDEYKKAYQDNPDKILVFYVGDGSPEVRAFRSRLDNAHARIQKGTATELVRPIADSVVEAVQTGKIVRKALRSRLDEHIERSRTLVTSLSAMLLPSVQSESGDEQTFTELVKGELRLALSGVGGSGKTTCAAIVARMRSTDQRVLPIIASVAGQSESVTDLIQSSLSSVRFRADPSLIQRWAGEGRLFLVIDGIESLSELLRMKLLKSVAAWAARNPRCGVIVCARQFVEDELEDFLRLRMAPLNDRQFGDLCMAVGISLPSPRFAAQVQDLAQWPMWATALIVFGPSLRTGLELLQSMVSTRLATTGVSSQVESVHLRTAAGHLALTMWPSTETPVEQALRELTNWQQTPSTLAVFAPRPSEDLLNDLSSSGLVEIGEELAFPHRLFATLLAAEAAVSDEVLTAPDDNELAPFVAAVADDDLHVTFLLRLLASASAFAVARYLRLAPLLYRVSTIEADSARLADAYVAMSQTDRNLDVIYSDNWVAWRAADAFSLSHAQTEDRYAAWRAESSEKVELWAKSPFAERSPEFVAAVYSLAQFRLKILDLERKYLEPRDRSHSDIVRLVGHPSDLEAEALRAAYEWKSAWRRQAEEMGLSIGRVGRRMDGEPTIVVHTESKPFPWVEIQWGAGSASVSLAKGDIPLKSGQSMLLARFLSDRIASIVNRDIETDIERALGCRLRSKGWAQPETVPAWAW
jgi:hypothetical protein